MSYNSQGNNQNPEQESLDNVKKVSQPLANKGKRKAVGAAARAGKKVLAAAGKALIGVINLLLPFILIILGILFISWLSYNIIFEWRGTEREYYQLEENPSEINDEGIFIAQEGEITERNKIIRDLYKYFGETSVWKVVGEDREWLERDGDKYAEVIDFENREELYMLNNHMLIALDDFLYDEDIRQPEQFTQKVNFNPKTLKLAPISDEMGKITVDSYVRDLKTGSKTGETFKSVRDYGLASILVYNEKDDYKRTLKIEGSYNFEDRWDESAKQVVQVPVDIPIENLVLDGYPEDIYVIDRATTFAGDIEYIYEYEEVPVRGMMAGIASMGNENKPYAMYHYDTYMEEYDCKMVGTGIFTEGTGEEIQEEVCQYNEHPLYRYRSPDTMLIREAPVVVEEIKNEDESNYYPDYIENFESYIHEDSIGEEKLFEKINYDSFVFDGDMNIGGDGVLEMGSLIDSNSYESSIAFRPSIKEKAERFNVNPDIIVAMIAQESGGNPNINRGLAQITYGKNEITKDASAIDKDGKRVSIKVERHQVNDPEIAISFMVIHYAQLLDLYNGDPLKAMMAYNIGTQTMKNVQKASGSSWDTQYDWMDYIEQGRRMQWPGSRSVNQTCLSDKVPESAMVRGDACYIYNVLRYYNGDDVDAPKGIFQRLSGFLSSSLKKLFPITDEPKLGELEDFVPAVHESIAEDILGVTSAFDYEVLFSEAGEINMMNFYHNGFFSSDGLTMGSSGMGPGFSFQPADGTPSIKGMIWPTLSKWTRISSPFGRRFHPIDKVYKGHSGVDIAIPLGEPLFAVADGVVTYSGVMGGYGNLVEINHGNGIVTRYAHNHYNITKKGAQVKRGDQIAVVGSTGKSTGPHIHFEVRVNGSPVNPMPWISN